MRRVVVLLAFGFVVLGSLPVQAQDVRMERTPFERELGIIPPTTEPARSRPEDADYHSEQRVGIIHEPALLRGALREDGDGGRFGLAGWSSPNSPPRTDYSEINGWLSFGFGLHVVLASPAPPGSRPALTADRTAPETVLIDAAPARQPARPHDVLRWRAQSAARSCAEYEARGYDFLAITDHEDHENLTIADYRRAIDALTGAPARLSRARTRLHAALAARGPRGGRARGAPRAESSRPLQAQRTRRPSSACGSSGRPGLPLDAVEVTDTGFYRPLYDTDEIPLVKIATDDAHRPPHFGRAWIEVEARRDRDAIIRAIRAGDCRTVIAASE